MGNSLAFSSPYIYGYESSVCACIPESIWSKERLTFDLLTLIGGQKFDNNVLDIYINDARLSKSQNFKAHLEVKENMVYNIQWHINLNK